VRSDLSKAAHTFNPEEVNEGRDPTGPRRCRGLARAWRLWREGWRAWGARAGLADLGLLVAILAVYAPVLVRGGFVWDDTVLLDRNSLVTGEATLATVWTREDFPLSVVVFAALHAWLGKSPTVFHWVNALSHFVAALLLRRVLVRAGLGAAGTAAFWFALHPVAVMSVAWISELKNTLSLVLALGSALCWFRFSEGFLAGAAFPREGRREPGVWTFLGLSWFLFALALLAKTSVVGLPVALLAWVYWRRGRCPAWALAGSAPLFVLALGMGLRTVWLHTHQVLTGAVLPEVEGWWSHGSRAGWVWWFYLSKAVWPLELCLLYPQRSWNEEGLRAAMPLIGWGVVVVLAAVAALRGRRGGIAWLAAYTASVFPVLGFFPVYFFAMAPVSDHFAYFALGMVAAGVAWVVAACGRSVTGAGLRWIRWLGTGGVVAGILLLGGLSQQRARLFGDELTLWEATLRCNSAAWPAHNNLGAILAERGDVVGAMEHFRRALELYPQNAAAHLNLGRVLGAMGRWKEAEEHFRNAVALKPRDEAARRWLAEALENLGRLEEAAAELRAALALKEDVAIRVDLAAVLRRAGDLAGAVTELSAAMMQAPTDVDVLSNLAWLLATGYDAKLRDPVQAVQLARRACALDPENARARGTLAAALAAAGQFEAAAAEAEQAAELAAGRGDLQFAEINRRLGALYRQGRAYFEPPPRPAEVPAD
jgi:Flp pilus assembly protein TadD